MITAQALEGTHLAVPNHSLQARASPSFLPSGARGPPTGSQALPGRVAGDPLAILPSRAYFRGLGAAGYAPRSHTPSVGLRRNPAGEGQFGLPSRWVLLHMTARRLGRLGGRPSPLLAPKLVPPLCSPSPLALSRSPARQCLVAAAPWRRGARSCCCPPCCSWPTGAAPTPRRCAVHRRAARQSSRPPCAAPH